LSGLTVSLAEALGPHNINVNCIAPEFIQTAMLRESARSEGMYMDDFKKAVLAKIPLRRLGTPEDVGHLAVFLAADEAGYISGQTIKISGGVTHA
jgi:3-oxoacyl-[acyl-carrier protein] reductase